MPAYKILHFSEYDRPLGEYNVMIMLLNDEDKIGGHAQIVLELNACDLENKEQLRETLRKHDLPNEMFERIIRDKLRWSTLIGRTVMNSTLSERLICNENLGSEDDELFTYCL